MAVELKSIKKPKVVNRPFYGEPKGYVAKTPNLQEIGTRKGFPLRMGDVNPDPFVEEALKFILGEVPAELYEYTRSGADGDLLYARLFQYDREFLPIPKGDPVFTQAVDITYQAFKIYEKSDPCDYEGIDLKLDRSAGFSFFPQKKREALPEAKKLADEIRAHVKAGIYNKSRVAPCMSFVRTQLATKPDRKVRLVWGYPLEQTLREGRFAQPLLDAYTKRDSPMFLGKSQLKELPIFLDNLLLMGDAVGIDWSGFDTSISPGLIRIAFDILSSNLNLNDEDKRELDNLVDYFIKTPILMYDGRVFVKRGGVPSGSFFTSMIDSVVNFLVSTYLQLKCYGSNFRTKVLGDDSLFSVPRGIAVDFGDFAHLALRKFGMVINTIKSKVARTADELEFLGHGSKFGKVVRDFVKQLALSLHPEHEVRDPGVSVSRVLGQLIDSGWRHPVLYAVYHYLLANYRVVAQADTRFQEHVLGEVLPAVIYPDEYWWCRT
jgi:hypothetical protein